MDTKRSQSALFFKNIKVNLISFVNKFGKPQRYAIIGLMVFLVILPFLLLISILTKGRLPGMFPVTPITPPTPSAPITPPILPSPSPANCPIQGCDVNNDGYINYDDGSNIFACISKPPTGACFYTDVVCDGAINIYDLQWLISHCPYIFASPTPSTIPSPSPSLVPSPSPIANNNPVITTVVFKAGRARLFYNSPVQGYDLDINDTLTLTATNLPPGLSVSVCKQFIVSGTPQKKAIDCSIRGNPTKSGTYYVAVKITDNRGGLAEKTIPIVIR